MIEARALGRSWWCRGGGVAVLMLLATVVWFRDARDVLFWAAIAFFVAHTGMSVWRYLADRRARTTAIMIRHHDSHRAPPPPISFVPIPITSLIRLDLPPNIASQQTKNHF